LAADAVTYERVGAAAVVTIDRQERDKGTSASTRRTLIKTTAAAMGSMGLLGFAANEAAAQGPDTDSPNTVENIAAVAATDPAAGMLSG